MTFKCMDGFNLFIVSKVYIVVEFLFDRLRKKDAKNNKIVTLQLP